MASEMSLLDESSSELSTAYMYSLSPQPGSSSPLSVLSRSPTPPRQRSYPSPPSSQYTSQNGSPYPDGMEDKEGQPPAKRRRIGKERTTEYLELNKNGAAEDQQSQLDRLLRVLHKRKKIVVVAGAGISVSAGIPDFRSKTGIFNSLKAEHKLKGSGKDMFDASVYRDHESTTSFHSMVHDMSKLSKNAIPTDFHHMLASLAKEGRLLRLYSQNVDGLEVGLQPLATTVPLRKIPKRDAKRDAKRDEWPKTVQLHGGLEKMICMKCHAVSDLDPSLFNGPDAPPCQTCITTDAVRLLVGKRSHGIGQLRPRMVLYSEPNPDEDAIGEVAREDLRRRPDAVIVVGTTLKVPGVRRIVREMCAVARDHRDGVTIWINNDPPPPGPQFEDCFDIVVTGTADEVAKQARLSRWDVPDHLRHEELPSDQHLNGSFRASSEGSNSPAHEVTAPAFSPMKPRKKAVRQTIELHNGDEIVVGLPTPTKSLIGSPAQKAVLSLKFMEVLAGPKNTDKKRQTKPAASKSNAKTSKKASKAQLLLNKIPFKASRVRAAETLSKKQPPEDEIKVAVPTTPSKLRSIVNATSSCDDLSFTPKKSSPFRPRPHFPNLLLPNENDKPAAT